MNKYIILSAAAALSLASPAQAMMDMVLLYDTYVDQGNPAAAYSGLDALHLQGAGQGIGMSNLTNPLLVEYSVQRIFLQFDLSSVPAGSVLTDAEFGIYLGETYKFDSPKIQLWFLNNDAWDNTLTWDSSLTLLGSQVELGIVQSTGSLDEYWRWTWSNMSTWDYTDALAAGKVSFLLTMDPEDEFNYALFNSNENEVFKPYLKLAYIPEPATITLLTMGIGALASSRRKL
jgi:hypothetical protein